MLRAERRLELEDEAYHHDDKTVLWGGPKSAPFDSRKDFMF